MSNSGHIYSGKLRATHSGKFGPESEFARGAIFRHEIDLQAMTWWCPQFWGNYLRGHQFGDPCPQHLARQFWRITSGGVYSGYPYSPENSGLLTAKN